MAFSCSQTQPGFTTFPACETSVAILLGWLSCCLTKGTANGQKSSLYEQRTRSRSHRCSATNEPSKLRCKHAKRLRQHASWRARAAGCGCCAAAEGLLGHVGQRANARAARTAEWHCIGPRGRTAFPRAPPAHAHAMRATRVLPSNSGTQECLSYVPNRATKT